MRCREALENLELFVLGDLPAAQRGRIAAHLAGCPSCRAEEEQVRLLVGQIRLGAGPAGPGPALRQAVGSAVAAEIGAQRRGLRRRRVFAAVAAAAAALVMGGVIWDAANRSGRAPAPAAPQPMGTARAVAGDPDAPAGTAPEKWRYPGARAVPASPADGVVIRGASMYLLRNAPAGSHVVAIDAATGTPRWQSKTPSLGYLAADASRVFCLASGGGRRLALVALDAADGKALWQYVQGGSHPLEIPSHPVPLSGGRVCWSHHHTVHMLDAKTGEPIWTRSVPEDALPSAVVAAGEALYVVTGKALHCLKAGSGEVAWTERFDPAASGRGRPLLAIVGQRVYFVQTRSGLRSELFCMDLADRRLVWSRRVPGARCLLATEEGVYLRGRRVVGLDGRTGQPLWARAAAGCGPLTHGDGLIHFVDSGQPGRLVALEQRTGRKAWEISGIRSCDAFTRVGSTGYIKTHDGIVHAIALRDVGPF